MPDETFRASDAPAGGLAILLLDGGYERAHYAFVLAAGALAVDRPVILFAAGQGVHALTRDWSGLRDAVRDAAVQASGVAGFDTLRAAVCEMDGVLLACESGLRIAGLATDALLPEVEVAGVPTFLDAARGRQIVSL
ncbi:DsrE family protein [Gluconacetobacter azotocaptans]|uniref:DsrE family protein n=1 Tax=Gluconacetobacter azotocaptans TaxID=142834 RepID=UPI00195F08AF|nr:DsrE family protein [Gluconacetobacter azotocaptans]MBM9402116.1 DsrE family protein [Gluconacetobacter azotocaptans]